MRIAITGASGFVGRALTRALQAKGHDVVRLVRRDPEGPGEVRFDPELRGFAPRDLGSADAGIHLGGENIAAGRFTAERKRRIRSSRVLGTRAFVRSMLELDEKPRVLLCASAIGIYGDRGDEVVDEQSPPGRGFLAETCREWEAQVSPAEEAGVRAARMRIGLVLGRDGGALGRMLPLFRLGLGGRLGSGRQWMSWISLTDLVRAFEHALDSDAIHGPVVCVAPEPVTNREFTRILARVLRRPALIPAPAFALRLMLGREFADSLLLSGCRAKPARLLADGFSFEHPELEGALRHILDRPVHR